MKIKTISRRLDNAETFDEEVNEALAKGWHLVKREVLMPATEDKNTMLYAELVELPKEEKEPVTWQEAVRVLRETCEGADDCEASGCPMHAWCNKTLPDDCAPVDFPNPDEVTEP